jgi:ribose/xylose/arabinose/galactoside ABC-type transport system permease subunit
MTPPASAPVPPIVPSPDPAAPSRYTARKTVPTIVWPLLALALLLLFNLIFTRGFFDIWVQDGRLNGTLIGILKDATPIVIVAAGMTLVIATGGVDLSVGAVAAIAGSLVAYLLIRANLHPALALALTLGVGLVAGLWNGALVALFGIQPIVATLILMVAGRGIAQMPFQGRDPAVNNVAAITRIAYGSVLGVPVSILLVAVVMILVALLARRTAAGLFIESAGSNPSAARYAGVNVRAVRLLAYAVTGLLSGVAGLWYVSNIKKVDAAHAGEFLELDAILAVVIGGTRLTGGRFYLLGSVVGAVVIPTLNQTILMMGKPSEYNQVIKAIVVLGVCLLQSEQFRSAVLPKRRR